MQKLELVKKFFNEEILKLYENAVKNVIEEGESWFDVESCNYGFVKEDWNGECDILLFAYGDRGGVEIGVYYEDEFEEKDEWEFLWEEDCEMSCNFKYVVETNTIWERYWDEDEKDIKVRKVEIS